MTFKQTIHAMRQENPWLFKTNEDVLRFLFLKPGNGYSWYHGQLVPTNTAKDKIGFVLPSRRHLGALYNMPDDVEPDWYVGAMATRLLFV